MLGLKIFVFTILVATVPSYSYNYKENYDSDEDKGVTGDSDGGFESSSSWKYYGQFSGDQQQRNGFENQKHGDDGSSEELYYYDDDSVLQKDVNRYGDDSVLQKDVNRYGDDSDHQKDVNRYGDYQVPRDQKSSDEDNKEGGDLESPGLFKGIGHAGKSKVKGEFNAARLAVDPIAQHKSGKEIISGAAEGVRAHYSTKAKTIGEVAGTVVGFFGGFGQIAAAFGASKGPNQEWARTMKSFSNHGPETFDESIVFLLGITKVFGDIADQIFPGVGTAWVEGWYGAAVIVTCNWPARAFAKFVSVSYDKGGKWVERKNFRSVCDRDFPASWGLRSFDGDYSDKRGVAEFYGLHGHARGSFESKINKYGGCEGSDPKSIMFKNMLTFFKASDKFSRNDFDSSKNVDFLGTSLQSWAYTISAFAAPFPVVGPSVAKGCANFINQGFGKFNFGDKFKGGLVGDEDKFMDTFSGFLGNGDFIGKNIISGVFGGDTDSSGTGKFFLSGGIGGTLRG